MQNILKQFRENESFWDVNPQFKIVGAFRDFYQADKSKDKFKSSSIMWAIAIDIDPINSIFANLQGDDRKYRIYWEYLVDGCHIFKHESLPNDDTLEATKRQIMMNFWTEHATLCTVMEELLEDKIVKAVKMWGDKLDERSKFLNDTDYTLDNASDLDKLMTNSGKIFELYKDAWNKYVKSVESGGRLIGEGKESAMEQGKI